MRRLLFLYALAAAVFVPGYSQESPSLAEAKAAFSKADRELNQVYQEAKTNLHEERFRELQQEQREWINTRESRSTREADLHGRLSAKEVKEQATYWETAAYLTDTRVEIIRGWILHGSFEKSWEGTWQDGNGGRLLIEETSTREFLFLLEVVRGPTYHTGDISGKAEVNGRLARFSVRVDPDELSDPPTWLNFTDRGLKLRIDAENTSYFHGMRAYFDGDYIRTSSLSAEDREAIRKALLNPAR